MTTTHAERVALRERYLATHPSVESLRVFDVLMLAHECAMVHWERAATVKSKAELYELRARAGGETSPVVLRRIVDELCEELDAVAVFLGENRYSGSGSRPVVPMLLHCPWCNERHIDEGEFASRPHHTHSCQECGMTWRPAVVDTVGVRFLPGFKNEGGLVK